MPRRIGGCAADACRQERPCFFPIVSDNAPYRAHDASTCDGARRVCAWTATDFLRVVRCLRDLIAL